MCIPHGLHNLPNQRPHPKEVSDAQFYMQTRNLSKVHWQSSIISNDKDMPAHFCLTYETSCEGLFMQESEGVQESQNQENQDAHDELMAE